MSNTVVISGANRGIGLALCQHYASRGDRVIALCRSASDALAATGATVIENVDVTNDESLAGVAARLSDPIDVLINNAGILFTDELAGFDAQTFEHMRRQFEVNSLGPLRTTLALKDNFAKPGKVAIITSAMGSISDNTSGGYYGYRASKAAVNIIGKSLAVDLAAAGLSVALIHPGYVRTDMTGGHGHIDTDEAAGGIARVVDALGADSSGGFWHSNGKPLAW